MSQRTVSVVAGLVGALNATARSLDTFLICFCSAYIQGNDAGDCLALLATVAHAVFY